MSVAVDDVVRSVLTVNDITTSNQERLRCTQALECLKEGPPDALARIGFQLIAKNDKLISHIGWTFVEEVVRYKWNDLTSAFRMELRDKILQSLESGLLLSTVEGNSRCVVAMMEHEWPQNWTELVSQLDQLSQMGSIHCTTVYSILRRLVENVVTLASVSSTQRRKDMHNAIVLYMPDMIKMSLDRLDGCPLNDEWSLPIKYIVSWLCEICEWVPESTLEAHLNRMIDLVVRHLNTAERNIYENAATCLAALAERKKDAQGQVVSAFFRTEVISTILSTASMAAEVAHSNELHYSYLKALCNLLSSIGNTLAKVWTENSSPVNFDTYLSAIAAFFGHPSLKLRSEACEVMISIATHPALSQHEAFKRITVQSLEKLPQVMEKVGYPTDSNPSQARHYSQMDFDDDLEWTNCFIRFRERIRVFISSVIQYHFDYLLQIFDNWIFQRIFNQIDSIRSTEWEAMQRFAKLVIHGGFEKQLVDEKTRDTLTLMGDKIIGLMEGIKNPDVQSQVLSIHSALYPTLLNHPVGINNLLLFLQRAMRNSGNHKLLNRHAISQLLVLVSQFPEFFKVNFKTMVDLVNNVKDHISPMQYAHLIQILAALSELVDGDVKIELLRMAVAPTLSYFHDYRTHFESVDAFILFNGFNREPAPLTMENERDDIIRRKELRGHLTALVGVLQQVKEGSPLGTVLSNLLPVFFRLNRSVQEIGSFSVRSRIHSAYSAISDITREEKQQIYCSVGESMEAQVGRMDPEVTGPAELANKYVNAVMDHCIAIISLSANRFSETFYNHPNISEMLMSTVVLNEMPDFRLRYWIKKGWKSLIVSCPPEKYPVLGEFFSAITEHLQTRLTSLWQEVANIDYDAEPTDAELFNEHLTCVISREYLQLLRTVYLNQDINVNNSDEKKPPMLSQLGELLCRERVGLQNVLNTVFTALTWRDSQGPLKAVLLCRAFVQQVLTLGYDDNIAVFMLVASIKSLQIHGSDEVVGAPLFGLIFNIYQSFRKYSESPREVLLQVPDVSQDSVDIFDRKIRSISNGEDSLSEKQGKDMTKKLLRSVISLTTGEQHRRPVYLRPLAPIERRRKSEAEPDIINIASFFNDE